jgi:hypothetical protein
LFARRGEFSETLPAVTATPETPEPYFVVLDDGRGEKRSVRMQRVYLGMEFGAERKTWRIVELDEDRRTARAEAH